MLGWKHDCLADPFHCSLKYHFLCGNQTIKISDSQSFLLTTRRLLWLKSQCKNTLRSFLTSYNSKLRLPYQTIQNPSLWAANTVEIAELTRSNECFETANLRLVKFRWFYSWQYVTISNTVRKKILERWKSWKALLNTIQKTGYHSTASHYRFFFTSCPKDILYCDNTSRDNFFKKK